MQAKGESLPKAERPAPDETQGDQVARTGESLPVPSQTSGPMEGAAPTENKASGDQGARAGESLPVYTSDSTEEVPALKGTPLSQSARMWTPSQFPLTMALCKDLRTGEFLPEEVQVYSLPATGQLSHPEDYVLKLCMVRQHQGKEFEWGSRCNLVAATFLKGQVSVDFGEQARFVHFSVQKRAVMVSDWLARWGSNPPLVRDMAHYLLATLLSLELRGAVLCDVGPSNAMVRANVPYAQAIYGDVAGWSIHKKLRHRGVGDL